MMMQNVRWIALGVFSMGFALQWLNPASGLALMFVGALVLVTILE